MDNFDWTRFTQRIAVRSSAQVLFDAWTLPGELEKWFLSAAHFSTADGSPVARDSRAQSGYRYTWEWFLFAGKETGRITATDPPHALQFSFAGECTVDINLEEKEEVTIVSLTQSAIPTDERSKQEIRLGCASGWAFYLVNLKSVYEGGLDLRNKEAGLGPMLNN